MKHIAMVFLIGISVFLLTLVLWKAERRLKYKLAYSDLVRSEIRAMVKQEALK